jgi:uncharacterized protein (TIGR01777 family)
MNVAIAGASGFVGRRLIKLLTERGHSVRILSRHAGTNAPAGVKVVVWDPMKGAAPAETLRETSAVIYLAGEPVAQRWNDDVKRRIRESRVIGTRNLVAGLSALDKRPGVLVCASATGFYGNRGDTPIDESSSAGQGFLPEVCVEWEREATAASALGLRVALIRTGIALHPRGGALERMLPPFRFGVGGRLGSGRQWMPWIHLDDLTGLYAFALENAVDGAFNGTAPNPVTNAEFTRALGHALHRPAILPVPPMALKLLFGEMANVLFDSQRVIPKRTQAAGFQFRFPHIEEALADLLKA